jgi:predicted metal-binding protein
MRKTERELRNWVLHLNSQLVRRGAVYSLYMKDGLGRACDRVDFQKLNEIEPWLLEWSDKQIALLSRVLRIGKPKNGTR